MGSRERLCFRVLQTDSHRLPVHLRLTLHRRCCRIPEREPVGRPGRLFVQSGRRSAELLHHEPLALDFVQIKMDRCGTASSQQREPHLCRCDESIAGAHKRMGVRLMQAPST
jgi:hypothetical protein